MEGVTSCRPAPTGPPGHPSPALSGDCGVSLPLTGGPEDLRPPQLGSGAQTGRRAGEEDPPAGALAGRGGGAAVAPSAASSHPSVRSSIGPPCSPDCSRFLFPLVPATDRSGGLPGERRASLGWSLAQFVQPQTARWPEGQDCPGESSGDEKKATCPGGASGGFFQG